MILDQTVIYRKQKDDISEQNFTVDDSIVRVLPDFFSSKILTNLAM